MFIILTYESNPVVRIKLVDIIKVIQCGNTNIFLSNERLG